MTYITPDWLLAPQCQKVFDLFANAGHEVFAVGGCVRNTILDRPVADVDMASAVLPQDVQALAQAAGIACIPTGIDHGTVTLLVDGQHFEITTFRTDVETDGRHARVQYSTDINDDAARRDFTMNALYARRDGQVLDPLGQGLADAKAGHIRFIGTAEARIREDYLRILRFFRFTAYYGDENLGLDEDGFAACAACIDGLDHLSKERVGSELCKILAAPDPGPVVASMVASGILMRILPGAVADALPVLVHLEAEMLPRWQRRLSLVGGQDFWANLRLSKANQAQVNAIRQSALNGDGLKIMGQKLGYDQGCDAALVFAALMNQGLPLGWKTLVEEGALAKFPISAQDLIGQLSGPALGAGLSALRQAWFSSDLQLSKSELLARKDLYLTQAP